MKKYTIIFELDAQCSVEVEAESAEEAIAKADYRDAKPETLNIGEARFFECVDEDDNEFDKNGKSVEPWHMPNC